MYDFAQAPEHPEKVLSNICPRCDHPLMRQGAVGHCGRCQHNWTAHVEGRVGHTVETWLQIDVNDLLLAEDHDLDNAYRSRLWRFELVASPSARSQGCSARGQRGARLPGLTAS